MSNLALYFWRAKKVGGEEAGEEESAVSTAKKNTRKKKEEMSDVKLPPFPSKFKYLSTRGRKEGIGCLSNFKFVSSRITNRAAKS